ncbi:MAG: hypothetical protein OEV23_07535, partial [Gallionella sp.]|nr:hypothetical protein [Gallionella sp.]
MPGEEAVITAVAVGGYVGTKLFGTALATMGDDINKLYVKGRDKIVEVAAKKVDNPDDGKKVNLRAARDVLWNGAITEDEVCAEYFGGMLAAARSEDGKDDAVVHYVDTIKAMSARQLELHYVIYKAWQVLLNQSGKPINVASSTDVQAWKIFMSGVELQRRQLPYDRDLPVLHRLGLISYFKYDNHSINTKTMSFVDATPTTFGVMLFAVAHNKIDTWRDFSNALYGSATDIRPLNY